MRSSPEDVCRYFYQRPLQALSSAGGKYRPEAVNDQAISMLDRLTVSRSVMAGLRPGHPRLSCLTTVKTWMPGTGPGMTNCGDDFKKFE
jgi:hypothetical protein